MTETLARTGHDAQDAPISQEGYFDNIRRAFVARLIARMARGDMHHVDTAEMSLDELKALDSATGPRQAWVQGVYDYGEDW